jgi:hypothetical protein
MPIQRLVSQMPLSLQQRACFNDKQLYQSRGEWRLHLTNCSSHEECGTGLGVSAANVSEIFLEGDKKRNISIYLQYSFTELLNQFKLNTD